MPSHACAQGGVRASLRCVGPDGCCIAGLDCRPGASPTDARPRTHCCRAGRTARATIAAPAATINASSIMPLRVCPMCAIARLRAANVAKASEAAVAIAAVAPCCSRPRGASAAPAIPALITRAARPRVTVRSGAFFSLSPSNSPNPKARAPNRNKERSSKTKCPGVRRPNSRAVAMAAIGVMDRALATAPIRSE